VQRKIVESHTDAIAELDSGRTRPQWREGRRSLPFVELSGDDFEVFCFLLLRKEFPGERIYYYGKTGDAGRDIVHIRPDGSVRLIQCKRYSVNVSIGLLKSELAKLFANLFNETIPERPSEVVFYVVPDITSPAANLLDKQTSWSRVAAKELQQHLKRKPEAALIDFATSWWTTWDRDNAAGLTQRVESFHDLRDEFFSVRKVIDASREQVRQDIDAAIRPVQEQLAKLLSQPRSSGHSQSGDQAASLSGSVHDLATLLGVQSLTIGEREPDKSTVESQQGDQRVAVDISRVIDSVLVGQLSRAFGVSSSAVLQTVHANKPPPLPNDHLPRPDVAELVQQRLNDRSILAMTGYEECGKSIALSEFAHKQPRSCIWFSTPLSEGGENNNLALFLFSLSSQVGAGSVATDDITRALQERLSKEPLLIVIDNAHLFGPLKALEFLFRVAASQPGRLWIVFGATDTPAFITQARTQLIPLYRIPGISADQACSMYRSMGIGLQNSHLAAVNLLCAQCDGHVGLLRLAANTIRSNSNEAELSKLFGDIGAALGTEAAQMHAALMSRFRGSLRDSDFQLCRRLAIALRPFQRRLAQALWSCGQVREEFQQTWNQCASSVFESHDGMRYSVPYLYHNGLKDYNDTAETALWHGVAADTLASPAGDVLDPFDVSDSVAHRLLAGNREAAMNQASGWLAIAAQGRRRDVSAFLLTRFEFWLQRVATDEDISRSAKVHWHAIRTRVCWDVGRRDEANNAAETLLSLLASASNVSETEDDATAWAILLLHSSLAGRPQLAVRAFNALQDEHFSHWSSGIRGGRVVLLISAFLSAGEDPLPLIHELICDPTKYRLNEGELWDSEYGFEYWRAIGSAIYVSVSKESHNDALIVKDKIGKLQDAYNRAKQDGQLQIAVMLGVSLVQLSIDELRDFDSASRLSEALVRMSGNDPKLLANSHHALGDAFRCGGRFSEAIAAYSTALDLWPATETFPRGQTILFLGVAISRNGNHQNGYKYAVSAAELYRVNARPHLQARALLEAAVMAMHAGMYPQALRCLIRTHSLLNGSGEHLPEWVALAQCASVLASRAAIQQDQMVIPVPGFTTGLRDSAAGGERMLPAAPTLMMSRACSAWARPHRSLSYFAIAQSRIGDQDLVKAASYFALEAALKAEQLDAAAKYAIVATTMPRRPQVDSSGATFDGFILDHVVANVVNLAIKITSDADAVSRVRSALDAVEQTASSQNDANCILIASLRGIANAFEKNETGSLEEAFQRAIRGNALFVARDLAWFWCFRFHLGRSRSEGEMIQWHWRLCWLSLTIGRNDPGFLASFVDQEKEVWGRVRSTDESSVITDVCETLNSTEVPDNARVTRLVSCFAMHVCEFFGAKHLMSEMADAITSLHDPSPLNAAVPHVVVKVLNLILDPAAATLYAELRQGIDPLTAAIVAKHPSNPSLSDWKLAVARLSAIVEVLRTSQSSPAAFHALLDFAEFTTRLSAKSEASWYVWLRHQFASAGRDLAVFGRIMEMLRSNRVRDLLQHPDVPLTLRHHLAICRLGAESQLASSRLASANATILMQHNMTMPLSASARISAENERTQALEFASAVGQSFDQIEEELLSGDVTDGELWSCRHERGSLRKFIGTLLCVQSDDTNIGVLWLRKAIDDFFAAISAAQSQDNFGGSLRSANEAMIIAEYLQLNDEQGRLSQILADARDQLDGDPIVQMLEESNVADPLNVGNQIRRQSSILPTEERNVEDLVDGLMKAMGLPVDRRRNVADDVRKQIRIDQEQRAFCRYLQPLQNLEHTKSPATAYFFRTQYTCSCTLLGYETVIDNDDIDVVIDAMQRTYCNECNQRKPGPATVTNE
jgi:tetratricopeptide (TPR) repeat protein